MFWGILSTIVVVLSAALSGQAQPLATESRIVTAVHIDLEQVLDQRQGDLLNSSYFATVRGHFQYFDENHHKIATVDSSGPVQMWKDRPSINRGPYRATSSNGWSFPFSYGVALRTDDRAYLIVEQALDSEDLQMLRQSPYRSVEEWAKLSSGAANSFMTGASKGNFGTVGPAFLFHRNATVPSDAEQQQYASVWNFSYASNPFAENPASREEWVVVGQSTRMNFVSFWCESVCQHLENQLLEYWTRSMSCDWLAWGIIGSADAELSTIEATMPHRMNRGDAEVWSGRLQQVRDNLQRTQGEVEIEFPQGAVGDVGDPATVAFSLGCDDPPPPTFANVNLDHAVEEVMKSFNDENGELIAERQASLNGRVRELDANVISALNEYETSQGARIQSLITTGVALLLGVMTSLPAWLTLFRERRATRARIASLEASLNAKEPSEMNEPRI